MDGTTKRQLTAPCGLDCFNCPVHEGNITDALRAALAAKLERSADEIACRGCRIDNGWPALGSSCETLQCARDRGVEFCFECADFPCDRLAPTRDGAHEYPHNFKLFNLCRLKAIGFERWANEEAAIIRRRYYQGKFQVGRAPRLES